MLLGTGNCGSTILMERSSVPAKRLEIIADSLVETLMKLYLTAGIVTRRLEPLNIADEL